jgi:hypothetical protein
VRRAGGRQGAGAGGDERTTGRGASASARARERASAHERFSRCLAPPGRRPDPPSPSLSPGFRCPRTRAHVLARLSVELRLWAWGKGRGKGTGVRGCQSNRAAALCVCVHPAPPARPAPRHPPPAQAHGPTRHHATKASSGKQGKGTHPRYSAVSRMKEASLRGGAAGAPGARDPILRGERGGAVTFFFGVRGAGGACEGPPGAVVEGGRVCVCRWRARKKKHRRICNWQGGSLPVPSIFFSPFALALGGGAGPPRRRRRLFLSLSLFTRVYKDSIKTHSFRSAPLAISPPLPPLPPAAAQVRFPPPPA